MGCSQTASESSVPVIQDSWPDSTYDFVSQRRQNQLFSLGKVVTRDNLAYDQRLDPMETKTSPGPFLRESSSDLGHYPDGLA
jgi:hypothetical protein